MKTFLLASLILTSSAVMAEEVQPREVTAIVSEAFVPSGFDSQSDAYVVVSGVFPNGCYKYKRSDVDHLSNVTHVVRVIAIVKPGVCPRMLIPFSEEVKLGQLETGKHTIRIVNGDNTYFQKQMTVE